MALIDLEKISFFGEGLQRPESVLTNARGEVFTCDRRGGIALVRAGKAPQLFLAPNLPGFLPNGFAMMPDRSFLVANLDDDGGVWNLTTNGQISPYLLEVDGRKLTTVNFIRQEIDIGSRRRLRNVSSLAFGGPDLRTVYLGSTHGDSLATFRSPVQGAVPVHWNF